MTICSTPLSLSLKVVGYYNHYNIGDEQYKTSFTQLFNQYLPLGVDYKIDFVGCDSLSHYSFSDTDVIVVGGGDVLNDYFLDQIIAKFTGFVIKLWRFQ